MMVTMVTVNGRKYEFVFDLVDGKATYGRFRGGSGNCTKLIDDIWAQYGKQATLTGVTQQICDNLKLWYVTVDKTTCTRYTYEVYASSNDDAMDEALEDRGYCIYERELSAEHDIYECYEEEIDDDD
jgi:hypothetical protein